MDNMVVKWNTLMLETETKMEVLFPYLDLWRASTMHGRYISVALMHFL